MPHWTMHCRVEQYEYKGTVKLFAETHRCIQRNNMNWIRETLVLGNLDLFNRFFSTAQLFKKAPK